MAPQRLQSCGEHKLPVVNDDIAEQRTARVQRAQWLRAAILGANDGLLSTTSLMLGIGAVRHDRWSMILSGLAGALAGACSMAVGEFVSVSTQRDIEEARVSQSSSNNQGDKAMAVQTQSSMPVSPQMASETPGRKLPPVLSPGRSPMMKVIMENATIKVEEALPNPYKAAAASALAFLCGSFVPLASAMFVADNTVRTVVIAIVTSIALGLFGGLGAHLGGSPIRVSAARVLVGGWMAMAITYGLLKPFERDERDERDE